MKIIEAPQGSDEWFAARTGIITASMFSEIRKRVGGLTDQQAKYVEAIQAGMSKDEAKDYAGYKSAPRSETIQKALDGEKVGDYTSAAYDYAFRLAVERIAGEPLVTDQFDTWAMRRGRELEPVARELHEQRVGMLIQEVGLVVSDCGRFGASADGFIGDITGTEYKCLINPERLREIILNFNLDDFMDQMQGGMWLTGFDFWHFGLYCPALKSVNRELIIHEVPRDNDYIAGLQQDLIEFDELVEKFRVQLEESSAGDDAALAFNTQPAPAGEAA